MSKTFDTLLNMKTFLSDNGIDISLSDLKYCINMGNIFIDGVDLSCYYNETENIYVLEW